MWPYLGPPWTNSCQIWCVRVFHHVLLKYGHENAEMQKRKFDDVTLQYSIRCKNPLVMDFLSLSNVLVTKSGGALIWLGHLFEKNNRVCELHKKGYFWPWPTPLEISFFNLHNHSYSLNVKSSSNNTTRVYLFSNSTWHRNSWITKKWLITILIMNKVKYQKYDHGKNHASLSTKMMNDLEFWICVLQC